MLPLQGEEVDAKPLDTAEDLRDEVGDAAVLRDTSAQLPWAGWDILAALSLPQVLQFNTNCPECNAPASTNMKLVRILRGWARAGGCTRG